MANAVYLIRHGMRHDRIHRSWRKTAERSYDTPLHTTGFDQLKPLGEFLKAHDSEIKHIYASPLLRAIQTADGIAKVLNLTVKIEPALIEHLKTNWFPGSAPTGPKVMPMNEVLRDYPTVDPSFKSETVLSYPETHEDVIERTKKMCKKLKELDGNIVLIGHGRSIKRSVQYFAGYKMKVRPRCGGLYKVAREDGHWILEINNKPF